MAGSYHHIIDDSGNLLSPEMVVSSLETGGDVYEAVEEMYGMIWWLAYMAPDGGPALPEELVAMACDQYASGIKLAEGNQNKGKHRG